MNQKISKYIFKEKIMLCYINRNLVEIEKHHPTYTQNKKNIVGRDIKYENFDYKIINNNEGDFLRNIKQIDSLKIKEKSIIDKSNLDQNLFIQEVFK